MRSFFDLLARRGGGLALLTLVIAAAGVGAAFVLPSSIFPSVTFPRVKLIADAGEEPAARMMPLVTRRLEEATLRVPGVTRVISTTARGSTEISAEFRWGTDMQVALQRVQAQVERVRPDLPGGTRVESEWMNTAIFPILGYALVCDSSRLPQVTAATEFELKPELLRIPGVGRVEIQGGREPEFQVDLDEAALVGRGLSAADVAAALEADNRVESAGLIERNHELYLSLVDGRATSLADLSRLAVPVPNGAPAPLSSLGTVRVGEATSWVRTTAGDAKGFGPAVLINVMRQPDADTLAIANGIDALLKQRPELVPEGSRWVPFYDQAALVRGSVYGVRDAIALGILLVGLTIFAFLRNLRTTLVAIIAIPLTVTFVLLGFLAFGQTLNLMTLGGIAASLGLVGDDAIVVVENIHRFREEGIPNAAREGLLAALPALAGSSLSTIIIFLPFAFLSGVVGAFFRPLALTMAMSLASSFLIAAVLVPIGAARLGSAAHAPTAADEPRRTPILDRVGASVRHPWAAAAGLLALLALVGVFRAALGSDFLPEMDEGAIVFDYWTPSGTSLRDTDAMLHQVERILQQIPDIRSWSRRTGTQLGFFITEPNTGDYVLTLKPEGQRRDVDDVIDDVRARVAKAEPAIRTDFGQLVEDDIADLTGGEPQPVDLRIFGEDPALLKEKARLAAKTIAAIPGVEDVFDGITISGPAETIRVDPLAAARYDLTTESIQQQVLPALRGTPSGDVRIGERVYGLRVFRTPVPLSELTLRTPAGALVPLTAVARVSTGEPEAEIDRENLKTYLGVTARLSGLDLGTAIGKIRRTLDATLRLPPGMATRFGGQYEQQQQSFRELFYVLLAGLFLVSVVLFLQFGDWRAPVLGALVSLASLASVFALLLVTGNTLNISSLVGSIMMLGIVGEKSVFVIHEARLALRAGASPAEAWATAARRRTRPAVMTVVAGALPLMPLALGAGSGAQLEQPLAIAVIGGFLLSAPLVLLVLPALYCALDREGDLGRT